MSSDVAERGENERKRSGPIGFFREVRAEARKVTWASRQETIISTIMVLVMVVIASVFFLLVDNFLHWLVSMVLGMVQ